MSVRLLHDGVIVLPDLLCIAEFDLRPLFDKFGVALHKVYTPLSMLLQVLELILKEEREKKSEVSEPSISPTFPHIRFQNQALQTQS